MSKPASHSHEPLLLDAGSLGRLEFTWTGDRYRHDWVPAGSDSPALSSLESESDAVWPGSPPLQQVHLQSFDDGREVIFGVGMSGRGHWSASFTMVPELHSWIVEFACRSPLVPEHLGALYELAGDWSEQGTGRHYRWSGGEAHLEPISPSLLKSTDPGLINLLPGHLPPSAPSTTQWAYRLKISR